MCITEITSQIAPAGTLHAQPVHSHVSFEVTYAGTSTFLGGFIHFIALLTGSHGSHLPLPSRCASASCLRPASHDTQWLRPGAAAAAAGLDVELYDGLGLVPPYDQDVDREGEPAEVARLRTAIASADAILFATPEYNGSLPGVLK